MDTYAIVRFGNKQHRVRDGETLVVERLAVEEGKSFEPEVLLGEAKVTATVVAHERGPKIRIGKYRRRTGYRRHTGFRAATTRVQIALGAGSSQRSRPAAEAAPAPVETEAEGPLPAGYDGLTVAEVKAGAEGWSEEQLRAAVAYEQEHAARKGALAALESALEKHDTEED